jgi:hypothetical protein
MTHQATPDSILSAHGGTVIGPAVRPATLDLYARPLLLRPPSQIPPRPWLYGRDLVRGYVTALIAGGGTGKTALAIAMALSLASGRELLGARVWRRARVWFFTLEDDLEELERRIAAARLHFDIDDAEINGYMFAHSGRDRPVIAIGRDQVTQQLAFPDRDRVIEQAKHLEVGLIVVDPYIRSHQLEENSNVDMDAAASTWAVIAQQTGAAVLLVHHTRKGALAGDIEASRGAKSLTDAARVGLLLSSMTTDEAAKLGVPEARRAQYLRLDTGKANLAPKPGGGRWLHLAGRRLQNTTSDYPDGDDVQVIEAWEPLDPFQDMDPALINRILDTIDAGRGEGVLFSRTRKGGSKRWAGEVIVRLAQVEAERAKLIIEAWIKSGVLIEVDFHHAAERTEQRGLKVVASKRPTGAGA